MSHRPNVLLVDDRPDNLLALEAQLRGLDAEFLKATSGREALDVLLEHDVAVAIIDVQMPEMDGFELAELMRGSPRTRAIPIVVITAGLHDRSRVFKGYEAGAVDFLIKPVASQVLTGKIAVFLQLDQQRQALAERVQQLEAAERAKQESERRFQTLADNILQLAWMARADGHIFWYNRRWYEYTATTPEQMEGWGWKSVHDPKVLPDVMQQWTAAIAAGHQFEMEFPLRGANGSFRRFLTRAFPLKSDDGRVLEWFGTNTDVTSLVETQRALQESERRYRDLFSSMTEGFAVHEMICDEQGNPVDFRFLEVNPAFERLTGLSRAMVGKTHNEVLPDDDPKWVRIYGKVALTGEPVQFEDYSPALGRWYEVVAFSPARGKFATLFSDITERKELERALRESEQRFRQLAEALPQLVFETDAVGEMGYFNEHWTRYTGCQPGDLEARSDLVHPDDRSRTRARWDESLRTGDVYECEYRFRRHDGAYRWFLTRALPRRDAEGRVVGWSGASTDIEDLKKISRLYAVLSKANEAIVRAKDAIELYRELCRVIAEDGGRPLVWVGLVEGRTVKPVAYHGPSTGYIDGLRIEIDGPYGGGPGGTAVRENRTVVNDDFESDPRVVPWRGLAHEHRIRASAVFPLRLQGVPFGELTLYGSEPGTFDTEEVRLFESLATNISYAVEKMQQEAALRESESSLREADRLKNEFLAVLSHELRNPLAPIKNSLYILGRAAPGGEQATRAKETIGRQVDQLTNLVNDLLDITRITRSKVRLQKETLDLNEIVRRTAEDNRSLFDKSQVELQVGLCATPITVCADRTRLAQVISNLLQNAAKFTPTGGRTRISVQAKGETAIVRVVDNGVGMAAPTLERLFQPFAQAAQSLDRSSGGLGLGLALVKGLVELHGGRVTARSEGLGKGSEFILELPCETGASVRASRSSLRVVREPRRILIIEDNRDAAESLREVLELEDHEVAVAHDGAQGLQKALEFKPDVVLCDIGLPGMDGYEVARALRADERLRSIHLVALSGYALPEDLRRASEAGFQDHLAKPPSIERLTEILSRVA